MPNKKESIPKGPGAIGKPLARSAEREPSPIRFPELSVKIQKRLAPKRQSEGMASPIRSFMSYRPGALPIRKAAACRAPEAKTERFSAL